MSTVLLAQVFYRLGLCFRPTFNRYLWRLPFYAFPGKRAVSQPICLPCSVRGSVHYQLTALTGRLSVFAPKALYFFANEDFAAFAGEPVEPPTLPTSPGIGVKRLGTYAEKPYHVGPVASPVVRDVGTGVYEVHDFESIRLTTMEFIQLSL